MNRYARSLIASTLVIGIIGFVLYLNLFNPVAVRKIESLEALHEALSSENPQHRIYLSAYEVICFTHSYGFALKQAKELLSARNMDTNFPGLSAAGGIFDVPLIESESSIVLLSKSKTDVLSLDKRRGITLGPRECEAVPNARIEIKSRGNLKEIWLSTVMFGR